MSAFNELLPPSAFHRDKHVQYFAYHLRSLPAPYSSLDTSRLTVLYFCLSALDVLGALDAILSPDKRHTIINWIYSLQVLPNHDHDEPCMPRLL